MNRDPQRVKFGPVRAMRRLRVIILALGLWGSPTAAGAVTFDEQAERLQFIYSFLLDYRPAQAPVISRNGSLEAALDFIPLPSIDSRVGGKDEPVDPPPIIPRPRLRYHSQGGAMLGVSYTPPLEVSGYEAALAAVEAGLRFPLGNWRLGLRAFLLDGEVDGPITDPVVNDKFELTNLGADAVFGLQLGFWLPYVGAGSGKTRSTMTIRSDGVMLETDSTYSYLLAGLTVDVGALRLTFEQNRSESVLDHFTFSVSLLF